MAKKNVLMLVGDFVEDYEAMVPFQILLMAGHEVATICPGKAPGDKVKTAVHDFEGDQTYSEKRGHDFVITHAFDRIVPGDFDALVIPGGRSPEYLRLNEAVLELVRHFFEEKKPVAAICHGPQILTAAGVLKDRECTAYFALRPEVEAAGSIFADPKNDPSFVHREGNLVSAVAWPAHPYWMREFLSMLGTEIVP